MDTFIRQIISPITLIVLALLSFYFIFKGLAAFTSYLIGWWYWRVLVTAMFGILIALSTRVLVRVTKEYSSWTIPELLTSWSFTKLIALVVFVLFLALTTGAPSIRLGLTERLVGCIPFSLILIWIGLKYDLFD